MCMRSVFKIILAGTVVVMLSALLSCGGGGQSDAAKAATPLSGNWQVTMQQSSPSQTTESEAGFLLQTGTSLSGSVLLSDQTQCSGVGSAQGSVTGSNVVLTVTQPAQTVSFTGTATTDGSTMSGNYSILTSGCGNPSTVGTWTANQVRPVKGNYQATFTSFTQT